MIISATMSLPEATKPASHKAFPFRDGTTRRMFYRSPYRFATACGLALQGLGLVPFDVDLLPEKKQNFFSRIKDRFAKKQPTAAWGLDIGDSCMKAVRMSFDEGGVPVVDGCYCCHYQVEAADSSVKSQDASSVETQAMEVLEKTVTPFAREEDPVFFRAHDELTRRRLAVEGFLHKNEYRGETICVGYPSRNLICANVALPARTPEVAESAIPYEFKHHLPFDEDHFLPNYMILGSDTDEDGVVRQCAYLFSTRIATMQSRLDLLDDFGIEPNLMTTNLLANLNYATYLLMSPPSTLEPDSEFEPPEVASILACDMGASGTDLVFYNMREILHYYIPIGGNRFTAAIAESLDIPSVRAEGFKRDPIASGHGDAIVEALKPVVKQLVHEIMLRMDRFRESGGRLDRVVVMGSGFQLQGFEAYFRNVLKALWK